LNTLATTFIGRIEPSGFVDRQRCDEDLRDEPSERIPLFGHIRRGPQTLAIGTRDYD